MSNDGCGALRRSVSCCRSALLLLACAALLTLPAGAAAQAATPFEEGIVEMIADRLPPLPLVVLVDSAGSMLLPIEHVTFHLGVPAEWRGGVLHVPLADGSAARLDTTTRTLHAPAGPIQLAPAELTRYGDLVYLRAEHLARLLDARIQVDFATLTVAVARDAPFPAQQRIVAEQRRAVLLARQRQLEEREELETAPYHPASGGAIIDWEVATASLDPARLTTIRTDAGVAVLGGDLAAGTTLELGRDAADNVRDITLRYHRVFPQRRYVRQVSAGDVLTSGLFARFMRGVEISNRPFLRSDELSAVLVHPDLPTGWEYEVFQGNQLLGYSDIASFDPVAVPLRSGTTPVQVRMYGPAGEEVISTLVYQTPVSLLLHNDVEYAVGGGRCNTLCDEFAHADVRYGVTPLTTVGAGFELLRDSLGSRFRPYFVYNLSSGQRVTAELTYMPLALYSANLALFPRDGSRLSVRGNVARPGLGPISLNTRDRMRWDLESMWDERVSGLFSQLRFGAAASGVTDGDVERWRISSLGSFSRGFLEARYDHDNTAARAHLLSGRAAVYIPVTIRQHTLRPLVNAALGGSSAGIRLAEAGISVQPRPSTLINAGMQWSRGASRPTFSLGATARTGSVQTALRAVSSAGGVATSSAMVRGSTAFTHDAGVSVHPTARTGYAGLHGTVFIDRDADGVLSPGDQPIHDAHLVVGSLRTTTDELGRYTAWGMQPYQAISVAIDSARTPDPSLTTSQSDIVVRPVPNMARRLDIPLVQTSELIGTVTADPAIATVAGVSLEITNRETGHVTTTATFSDGLFYVSRLRPGRYRLVVAAASLDALNAAAQPAALEFTVSAAPDDPVVELPALVLRRR